MVVKLKMFKRDNNRDFHLVQNLTTGEAVFSQFMLLRNQLAITTENFVREDNLSQVLIPRMSNDMDEQLKLDHNVIDVVDEARRKLFVTPLRYNGEKPESSYAQIRLFPKKKEDK